MRSTPSHLFLAAVAGALALGMTVGCNRPSGPLPERAERAAPPEVKVTTPKKTVVRRQIERPAYNIEAYERTPLYAKLAGYIRKWNFDIGARVRKDDILAEVYIPEMEVELKQKEAAGRQAASEIDQARAAVERTVAERERARSQYKRLSRVGQAVIDQDQLDEARLAFESASAAVTKAQADVSVAEARLDVAKADRDHVQTLLQYTRVRAPFDGVVTRRNINTGDFVHPVAASKGDALFVVETVDPVRVFVNVQELEARWINVGDTVVIRGQGLHGQQFRGTVTRTAGALHPQTRTLRTEIDLPNPDGKLLPGMYVTASIIAERKDVMALPASAIITQGEQTFCYRIEGNKVVRTPIQVGLRGDELVEVLGKRTTPVKPDDESGWEAITGKEQIAEKAEGLEDGQEVHVGAGSALEGPEKGS
jgi:RND family efflux transporter MFP subunit